MTGGSMSRPWNRTRLCGWKHVRVTYHLEKWVYHDNEYRNSDEHSLYENNVAPTVRWNEAASSWTGGRGSKNAKVLELTGAPEDGLPPESVRAWMLDASGEDPELLHLLGEIG